MAGNLFCDQRDQFFLGGRCNFSQEVIHLGKVVHFSGKLGRTKRELGMAMVLDCHPKKG